MTEPEPRIVALIDAYAPAAEGTPDWQDVVRRASAPAARRLFTAPRILLIAAALAVLLAGSALAGVGPGRILLGLVRDDEPAPAHGEARAGPHVPVAARHARHPGRVAARLPPDRGDAVGRRRTGHHAGRRELDRAAPRRRVLRRPAFVPAKDAGEGYSYSCVHGPLNPDVRLIQESPSGWRKTSDTPVHWDRGSWTAPSRSRPRGSCSCTATARKRRCRCRRRPVGQVRYFAVRLRPQSAAGPAGPASFVALDSDGRRLGVAALTRRDVRPLITTLDEAGPSGGGPTVEFGSIRGTFQGQPGTARLSVEVNPERGAPGAWTWTSRATAATPATAATAVARRPSAG